MRAREPISGPAPRRSLRPEHLLCAALLLACQWAVATAYRGLTPAETLLRADLVVLATVADVGVRDEGELVWTTVTFDVEMPLGGPASDSEGGDDAEEDEERELEQTELALRFLGGAPPGDAPLLVAGMPSFSVGERVILALHTASGLASPLVGFEQGLWRLDGAGARDTAGFYLGLVPAAAAGATGDSQSAEGADEGLTLARSTVPTGVDELVGAIQRLLAGDQSLARPPAAESATPGDDGPAEAGDDPDAPPNATAQLASLPVGRYLVENFGGPLLLSDEVAAAAAVWEALAPGALRLVEHPDATALFAYGDEALFDADTFAITLLGGGASRSLISPSSGAMLGAALRHELGLVLGLPESAAAGPLTRALTGPQHAPGAPELAALAALATAVPGDLNGDDRVDLFDLLEFAARFGRTGLNEPADLDRDGVVDEADLEMLRSLYEFLPPGADD